MTERLGLVLYWAGCLVAAGFLLIGVWVATNDVVGGVIYGGLGGLAWLVGRGLRFILKGD